jgi:hypothetical protein
MKQTGLLLVLVLLLAPSKLRACDICGCGVGSYYLGILPEFKKRFIGLRYQHKGLITHLNATGGRSYLTTNETYFFREPKHFEFFRDEILQPWRGDSFRVWSAASSTGEEAYSLAMVLSENLRSRNWEIFASDLSTYVSGQVLNVDGGMLT